MSIRDTTVAIIGQGYVGLPLAMAAVDSGWIVIGIENSQVKFAEISAGVSPVEDVASSKVATALASGAYRISNSASAVSQASIIVICVPTPLDEERAPDLGILKRAIESVAPHLSNDSLVINESTSYPGTVRDFIAPLIAQLKARPDISIDLAVAPG